MTTSTLFLDFDGTLVDSMPIWFARFCRFMEAHGAEPCEKLFESMQGCSQKELVLGLKEKLGLSLSYDEALKRLDPTPPTDEVELFDGTREFLQEMLDKGLSLVIVSASTEHQIRALLEKFGITDHFDAIVTPEGLPRSKPDPAVYHRALDVAGRKPDEVVTVEDAFQGAEASRGAGIPTIGICHRNQRDWSHMAHDLVGTATNWDDVRGLIDFA